MPDQAASPASSHPAAAPRTIEAPVNYLADLSVKPVQTAQAPVAAPAVGSTKVDDAKKPVATKKADDKALTTTPSVSPSAATTSPAKPAIR